MPITFTHIKDLESRQRLAGVCKSCYRSEFIEPSNLSGDMRLDDLPRKLRCSVCGSRDCGYQIVWD